MHRLMELLRNPSQSQLAILARKWFPSREQEALAAIQWAQALREPPLLQLIRDGAAEWGYAAREGRAIVEGQIDLWGRDEGGTLWIVDYKSGSPERRALAQAQLSLYALGLRRAGELREGERARLAAVYPFSGQVFVEPEPDPSATRAKFGLA
jgi:ATP-dependent helicase/nuclease subunit A